MNKNRLKVILVSQAKKIMGEKVISFVFQEYYLRQYKKNKAVFIHIPKAAGTSIANAIYGKRNGHLKASFVQRKLGSDVIKNKYLFSVCRNPYSRLLSAYSFALQGATKDVAIAHFKQYKAPTFASFKTFVKDWLVNKTLHRLIRCFSLNILLFLKMRIYLLMSFINWKILLR